MTDVAGKGADWNLECRCRRQWHGFATSMTHAVAQAGWVLDVEGRGAYCSAVCRAEAERWWREHVARVHGWILPAHKLRH